MRELNTRKALKMIVFGLFFLPVIGMAASLSTTFSGDNGFSGNTFDVTNVGSSPVQIDSFAVNLENGSTPAVKTIDVYFTPNTSVGVENNAGSWTLMGSDNNVVSNGPDVPTPVNVGGLVIAPGQSFGIYVDLANYDGNDLLLYTNGGPSTFTDGVLQIDSNTGQGNPAFTGSFFPRIWNGTINYTATQVAAVPSSSLISLLMLMGALGLIGIGAQRSRQR